MDKKFYQYHLKNIGLSKLLKIKYNAEINIFSNSTNFSCKLLLMPNGYEVIGKNIPQIKVYYDSTNYIYYICSDGHDNLEYINFGVNISNNGYAISEYEDNFDTTNLILLTPLNVNGAETNRNFVYSPQITANTVIEYISKTTYRQYMAQCSLIMLSLRNSQGTGGSGLYLIHRKTQGTLADTPEFTIQTIYEDTSLSSNFSITGTKSGISFTNGYNFKYSITEISNNTSILNSL